MRLKILPDIQYLFSYILIRIGSLKPWHPVLMKITQIFTRKVFCLMIFFNNVYMK